MSLKEMTMYQVVCDHEGCDYSTFEANGEFAAWGDHGQALDDWFSAGLQSITVDGEQREYCDAHRVPQCTECDGPGQPLDVHDEGFCEKCAAEDAAATA